MQTFAKTGRFFDIAKAVQINRSEVAQILVHQAQVLARQERM
jgi:hypothetical protein